MLDQNFMLEAPERIDIPTITIEQMRNFDHVLKNFLAIFCIQINKIEGLSDEMQENVAILRSFSQSGTMEPVSFAQNNIACKIINCLLKSSATTDPRDFSQGIADYLHSQQQECKVSREQIYALLIAVCKKHGVDPKGGVAFEKFTKSYTQPYFKHLEIPKISVATSTGRNNNCGLHGIIHTYWSYLLQLPYHVLLEKIRGNELISDIGADFFDSYPILNNDLSALLAFNQRHNTPADRELLWAEIFREQLKKNKELLCQERCEEEKQKCIAAGFSEEDAALVTQEIYNAFMQPIDTGNFIQAQVLLAFAKKMGCSLAIYDRQGERRECIIVPEAPITVHLVCNINPGPGNHYDFWLPPEAMLAHNEALAHSLYQGLSGYDHKIQTTIAEIVTLGAQIAHIEKHRLRVTYEAMKSLLNGEKTPHAQEIEAVLMCASEENKKAHFDRWRQIIENPASPDAILKAATDEVLLKKNLLELRELTRINRNKIAYLRNIHDKLQAEENQILLESAADAYDLPPAYGTLISAEKIHAEEAPPAYEALIPEATYVAPALPAELPAFPSESPELLEIAANINHGNPEGKDPCDEDMQWEALTQSFSAPALVWSLSGEVKLEELDDKENQYMRQPNKRQKR